VNLGEGETTTSNSSESISITEGDAEGKTAAVSELNSELDGENSTAVFSAETEAAPNAFPKKVVKLALGMELQGRVTHLTKFGAFVDIGVGRDGLVPISQLSSNRVEKVSDVVSEGDDVTVWIKSLDRKRNRIGLTMLEPPERDIHDLNPDDIVDGKVTRMVPYGAFVDIGVGRDGLLHIREMSEGYVQTPTDVVNVGDEIKVRILKVNPRKRQVDLSLKDLPFSTEAIGVEDKEEYLPTAMEVAMKRAMARRQKEENERRKRKGKKAPRRRKQDDDIAARTLRIHKDQQK
jgi:small subunit ribosomal protein S1